MFKKSIVDNKKFYINILIGAGIGTVVTLILLFGAAAIMVICNVGQMYASPISSVVAAIGGFIGGYFSARKNGVRGLLGGLLVALIMVVLISLVGAFVSKGVTLMSFIRLIVIVLAASIGGILGVNKSSKVKIV